MVGWICHNVFTLCQYLFLFRIVVFLKMDIKSKIKDKIEAVISNSLDGQSIQVSLSDFFQRNASFTIQTLYTTRLDISTTSSYGRYSNVEGAQFSSYSNYDETIRELTKFIYNDRSLINGARSRIAELGYGTIVEPYFYGTYPTIIYTEYECHMCDGRGKVTCPSCSGTGRVHCNSCDGSGRCSSCGGDGRTQENKTVYEEGSYVGKTITEYVNCSSCFNFNGRCTNCKGSGSTYCYSCSNSSDHTVSCSYCNGTGYRSTWSKFDVFFEPKYDLLAYENITQEILDNVLRKIPFQSMAKHCDTKNFNSIVNFSDENNIFTLSKFNIPYFYGTFELKDQPHKKYDFLLFGVDFHVISLGSIIDTFIEGILEQALSEVRSDNVTYSDHMHAKQYWDVVIAFSVVRSIVREYRGFNYFQKNDKKNIVDYIYSNYSDVISYDVSEKVVNFVDLCERNYDSYFYKKYGKKMIAFSVVFVPISIFLSSSYMLGFFVSLLCIIIFFAFRKKLRSDVLKIN